MSSLRRTVLTIALGVLVGAGPALAQPAAAGTVHRNLAALLTGGQEVPGPGDTDAWGAANVRVWPATGKVCYTLYVTRVDGVVDGAHIHLGKRGETGAVLIRLNPPVKGWSAGCTTVEDDAAAMSLAYQAYKHYVNVHSTAFPNGAVRGQLKAH